MLKRLPHIEALLYVLISYPLFYYAYKFGSPFVGGLKDYYSYYKLYLDWNFEAVQSPFNQRILSTYGVYIFNKIGFAYDTEIVHSTDPVQKQVFFNAILFNYLSLIFTSLVIYKTALSQGIEKLYSFLAGALYVLGFGTLFFNLNGLTESFSTLLCALMFYFYLKKSNWIILPMILAILQREYLFFAFGLMALVEYFAKEKNRFYLKVLGASILCFVVYFILRKTIFFTPKYQAQLDVTRSLLNVFKPRFPLADYIKQTFMIQNILFLYFFVLAYKWKKKLEINKVHLLLVLLLFLQANLISLMAVLGNSTGRYFYLLTPIVIYYLVVEVKKIHIKESNSL